MRRRETYWSLYDKSESRQIDDLKTDYIEVVHEVIPVKARENWLIWREGFAQWKPLAEFPTLLASLRKGGMLNADSIPAPAPTMQKDLTTKVEPARREAPSKTTDAQVGQKSSEKAQESAIANNATSVQTRLARQGPIDGTVDLDLMNENVIDQRDRRYKHKWSVKIMAEGSKVFTNQTVDVSNGGMSLKDPLPKGLPQYFNVELQTREVTIPLICSEFKMKTGEPSKRLHIEVNHNPTLLQTELLR